MSELVLAAESGRIQGSPASRRMRSSGQVPGVVYGGAGSPVAISCNSRELRALMSKRPIVGSLITLELDGKARKVICKELQKHPVRPEVLHVDFQLVDGE